MGETNLSFPYDFKELEPEEQTKLLKAYKSKLYCICLLYQT